MTTRKLSRDEFQLKSWVKSNMKAFEKECPDNADFKETHGWWEKRAAATLEPDLALEVSNLLGAGVAVGEAINDPNFSKVFIEVAAPMIGIEL